MKKSVISILVILTFVFALKAQAPQQPKPEDVLKNLCLVEKPHVPPERVKGGYDLITAKDSITMLSFISSDLMEGRETATRGYQLASEYVSSLLSLWKLKPAGDTPGMGRMMMRGMGFERGQMPPQEKSYLQELVLRETSDVSGQLVLEIKKGTLSTTRIFQSGLDFMSVPSTAGTLEAPVVFAGYGITEKEIGYDDFKNLDVKGKIVLIISEAPGKDNPNSPFQKKELKDKYFPAAAFGPFGRGGGFSKTREIAKLGAAAILQVQNSVKDADMYKRLTEQRRVSDERPIINKPRRRLSVPGGGPQMPGEALPVITITREMANAILEGAGQKIEDLQKKIDDTFKPASTELPGTTLTISTTAKTTLVRSANILAYIEGADPTLKNEFVVVGAHLDHLGKWEDYVFNGADDNGSGSVGVLNLARAFMANPEKPKRSILFCLWTGEEEGLLGSRYYVQNPVFPLDKTIAYINMDMISRPYDEQGINRMSRMLNIPSTEELLKKIKPANFLPVSFSAGAGLGDILKNVDQSVGMDLLLREASGEGGRGMGGSDHASFASVKIPWVFLMASMTSDYHQTSDEVSKVSGETIEKISKLAYLTAFALADK
jgi:hypothetical protein